MASSPRAAEYDSRALDLSVSVPTIAAALDARGMSSLKSERVEAAKSLSGPDPGAGFKGLGRDEVIADLEAALYAARICDYAQGMALIRAGAEKYNWTIDLAEIGRIWKGGCIIRARLLDPVRNAFKTRPDLANLFVQFRRFNDGKRLAGAYPVPDIHHPLLDIAVGPCEHRCFRDGLYVAG